MCTVLLAWYKLFVTCYVPINCQSVQLIVARVLAGIVVMYKLMSTREYLCFESHLIILKETSQKPVQFSTSVLSSGDTSSKQELMNR